MQVAPIFSRITEIKRLGMINMHRELHHASLEIGDQNQLDRPILFEVGASGVAAGSSIVCSAFPTMAGVIVMRWTNMQIYASHLQPRRLQTTTWYFRLYSLLIHRAAMTTMFSAQVAQK